MYDIEMIDVKPTQLLGYEHQGDYMNIGQAFEKLFIGASTLGLIDGNTRSIGIYYDDPQSVPQKLLRSVACISVPDHAVSDNHGMKKLSLPAGRCATVLHKGSYAELEKPYSWLFGSWLPSSGEEAGNFPPFEEYLNDPKTTPPSELLTRIYCVLAD